MNFDYNLIGMSFNYPRDLQSTRKSKRCIPILPTIIKVSLSISSFFSSWIVIFFSITEVSWYFRVDVVLCNLFVDLLSLNLISVAFFRVSTALFSLVFLYSIKLKEAAIAMPYSSLSLVLSSLFFLNFLTLIRFFVICCCCFW